MSDELDPAVAHDQRRAAQHMVIRVLLSDLYVALCMAADDPIAECTRRKGLQLGALDSMLDERGDWFLHCASHEYETFWQSVEREVRERVDRGL